MEITDMFGFQIWSVPISRTR